jgi:hypothetical protein
MGGGAPCRVGQKGSLTHLLAPIGMLPRTVRDHRFKSAYISGAVCPDRYTGMALVVDRVSAEGMNLISPSSARPSVKRHAPPCQWIKSAGVSTHSSGLA